MTYVWINTNTMSRFVDDQYLPPCDRCGKRVSICRANDCLGDIEAMEPADCIVCNTTNGCRCDAINDKIKEMDF